MPFDRSNRTYHVSDERLRAFRTLSPEDKVRWVEQLVTFLRLVSLSKAPQSAKLANTIILRRLTNRGVKLHILIGQSWQASPLTTARAPD